MYMWPSQSTMALPLTSSFDAIPFSTSTSAVGVWTAQLPFARAIKTSISGVLESQLQSSFPLRILKAMSYPATRRKRHIVFTDHHLIV